MLNYELALSFIVLCPFFLLLACYFVHTDQVMFFMALISYYSSINNIESDVLNPYLMK